MRKYKKPLSEQDNQSLNNLSQKDFTNFNETDIREEFLTPIVKLLGYSKETDYEVEREEHFKVADMYINVGRDRIKLDYIFNIRKNNFWLIEAKSGKTKEITQDDVHQAYLYSLHPKVNCRYFVVSNGWLTNLYDRNKALTQENANILEPVLSIKSSEIKNKFDQLYSKLAASEILFSIKEDYLLKEIEKVMSAEVYINRLDEFERKVGQVIIKSKPKVYENIRALNPEHDILKKLEKDRISFSDYINTLSEIEIVRSFFPTCLTTFSSDIICNVLKEKIYNQYNIIKDNLGRGYCGIDYIFDTLFLEQPFFAKFGHSFSIYYCFNIVQFLLCLHNDDRFKNVSIVKYRNSRISAEKAIKNYLLDTFSFFENRKELRYTLSMHPIYYRFFKHLIFGSDAYHIFQKLATTNIQHLENLYTEEELSGMYLSEGSEKVNMVITLSNIAMKDFGKNIFGEFKSNLNEALTTQIMKNIIIEVQKLDKKQDLNSIKQQLSPDKTDEMFAIDNHWKNPWSFLFTGIINILTNNNYTNIGNELEEKLKEAVNNGFIGIGHYITIKENLKNFRQDYINKNKEALLKYEQYKTKLNINDKSEEISLKLLMQDI